MISLIENYSFKQDVRTELDGREWNGRPILDLIPEEYQYSPNLTLQVCQNLDSLTVEDLAVRVLADGDSIRIRIIPKADIITVAFVVQLIIGLAVGYAISAIINAIIGPPKKPKKDLEESATYDFDTAQNTTRNGTAISVVYGQIRVAGQILLAKTSTRTDGKVAVRMLIGLGEGGDYGWQSICGFSADQNVVAPSDSLEINGNVASTYQGVVMSTRLGSPHQGIIANFTDSVIRTQNLDILLTSGNEQIYSGVNPVDSTEIKLRFPNGLFALSSKGNLTSKTVTIDIRYRTSGGSFGSPTTVTITRSTRQEFTYSYRIDGRNKTITDVGVKRITADDVGVNSVSIVNFYEANEITNDDLAYPNKVLVGIDALATDQLHGNQPSISCLVQGLKVRVYSDVDTYSPIWTQNPSWIILDLLTNKRYGLGQHISISDCDIQSFIDFAAFCDYLVPVPGGASEPRCRCNIVIDTIKDAWDWIYEIAQTSFASIFSIGGVYRIKADTTGSPVMMFTPGNTKNVVFGYTPPRDRINYVEASFPNESIDYAHDYVVGLDPSVVDTNLYVKESTEFLSITRRTQALRLSNYRINANTLLTRYASWESDIAAMRCEPNDIVELGHDSAAWGLYSGIVQTAGTADITVDREITFVGGHTYLVRVFHSDGSFESKTISQSAGTYTRFGIVGSWDQVPQQYRPYWIGEQTSSIKQFKVMETTMNPDMTVKIYAIEYNPLAYADTIIAQPTQVPEIGFNPGEFPPDVTNLSVKERVYINPDGSLTRAIDVSFNPPVSPIYAHADIWIKFHADATWPITPSVSVVKGGYFQVPGAYDVGTVLDVAVSSASVFGIRKHPSLSPQVTITLANSTTVPADVTGFTVVRYGDNLAFSWTANVDADIDYYEIRNSTINTWVSSQLISKVSATAFDTPIFFASTSSYTTYYLIKAVNTSANSSANAASVTLTIDPKVNQNIVIYGDYRRGTGTNLTIAADWATGTITNFDLTGSTPKTLGVHTVGTQSVFETNEIDIGSILRSRVTVYAVGQQIDPTLDWSHASFTWDQGNLRNWTGPIGTSNIAIQLQWKFGNTTGSGSYAPFIPQEATFRYARFKVLFDVTDTQYDGELVEFQVTIDVPDIIDHQTVTVTNGTGTITYGKSFTQSAKISKEVNIKDGRQGDYYAISSETNSGFTITIYDQSGVQLGTGSNNNRTVDVLAKGY
jgi:predicted phage tail protein